MSNTDGHRFVETSSSKNIKVVTCTRWAEIQETVLYHAEISALLQAPTVFRVSYLSFSYVHSNFLIVTKSKCRDAAIKYSRQGPRNDR